MERQQIIERWTHRQFTLATGNKAEKGKPLMGDPATGRVRVGGVATGLVPIGYADETIDATAAEKPVTVDLGIEIELRWLDNAGGITAADVFKICYLASDQSVTLTATGNSIFGRIWAVDPSRGVAVQLLRPTA